MVEANQEKLQAKMEENQEKIEAVAEHYMWEPHIKATRLLTAPECRASDVLHGVPEGATYKERTDWGTCTWPQHTTLY
jgi:hypothetical protein